MGPTGPIVFLDGLHRNSNARDYFSPGLSLLSPANNASHKQQQRYTTREESHPTADEPESLTIVQWVQPVQRRVACSILRRVTNSEYFATVGIKP
jgi:hypothetical protein